MKDLDSVILGGFRLKVGEKLKKYGEHGGKIRERKRETREIERKVSDFQGR